MRIEEEDERITTAAGRPQSLMFGFLGSYVPGHGRRSLFDGGRTMG
ncbi:hypothetical protein ACWDR3_42945 [Streptomyces sp. NPDC001002]